jgi:hypothetical protein
MGTPRETDQISFCQYPPSTAGANATVGQDLREGGSVGQHNPTNSQQPSASTPAPPASGSKEETLRCGLVEKAACHMPATVPLIPRWKA